ncbi:unnamed protein product [Cuscuta epithymum]|uniref:Uncharacterized protein n=1 Tax=Cuscuta epithymum TaxID=186058 RepID=A0AAV0FVX7_9ASTE|nr:unnamed protein product [Cuscuta epithymum]
MAAVTLSQYLLPIISVMIVGHLGELYLSSTSIAVSIAGVTGFSFMGIKVICPSKEISKRSAMYCDLLVTAWCDALFGIAMAAEVPNCTGMSPPSASIFSCR